VNDRSITRSAARALGEPEVIVIMIDGYAFRTVGTLESVNSAVLAGGPIRTFAFDPTDGEYLEDEVLIHAQIKHIVTDRSCKVPAQWLDG
jgi:hypothetical protein